jgi:phosphoribosyl 1,2-cyclic phosphodiesterase
VHIDPGPGALVFSNWARLNPQKLDGVVVTHCHPDHYTDAEVFLEAMSHGTRHKRGTLAAPKSVLIGSLDLDPSVSRYHQGLVSAIEILKPRHKFSIEELEFRAMKAIHSDTDTVGLRVDIPHLGGLGYTSDTGPFSGLGENYAGLRLLILCTMWPRNNPLEHHLSTDDVVMILEEARPGCAILTHFGMRMLNADPEKEAEFLECETGIPTIAAKDGMTVEMGSRIEIQGPRKRDETRFIDV